VRVIRRFYTFVRSRQEFGLRWHDTAFASPHGVPRTHVKFRARSQSGVMPPQSIIALICLLLFASSVFGYAQSVEFRTIDIFVDSGRQPLGAYQLEFSAPKKSIRIIGIEGGEHEAFKEPPYYDPKAMQQERVILAAFNTGKNHPTGKTRVATIHVQVLRPTNYRVKLDTAADSEGTPISVQMTFSERKSE
jgi:hypothetical protein